MARDPYRRCGNAEQDGESEDAVVQTGAEPVDTAGNAENSIHRESDPIRVSQR